MDLLLRLFFPSLLCSLFRRLRECEGLSEVVLSRPRARKEARKRGMEILLLADGPGLKAALFCLFLRGLKPPAPPLKLPLLRPNGRATAHLATTGR